MRLVISILTTLALFSSQVMAGPCGGECHGVVPSQISKSQDAQATNHDCCDESLDKGTETPCHSENRACLSQCAFDAKFKVKSFTYQNESGNKVGDGLLATTSTFNQLSLDNNRSKLVARVNSDPHTSRVPIYIYYQKLLIP